MVRKAGHLDRARMTYSMGTVFSAGKVYHAVDAGEGGAAAAVTMRIKLLLSENVPAGLWIDALDVYGVYICVCVCMCVCVCVCNDVLVRRVSRAVRAQSEAGRQAYC